MEKKHKGSKHEGHMHSHTMKAEHGHGKLHHRFLKGGAMKHDGHHGLIGTGKHKGGGSLIATPSNVTKLGSK